MAGDVVLIRPRPTPAGNTVPIRSRATLVGDKDIIRPSTSLTRLTTVPIRPSSLPTHLSASRVIVS
jgi:hypothetical protein